MTEKDMAVQVFLDALTAAGTDWRLMDHWEGDLCSAGVSSPDEPARLAYVTTWLQVVGRYRIELEEPGATLTGYREVGAHEGLDLQQAVGIVSRHLSGGSPRPPR